MNDTPKLNVVALPGPNISLQDIPALLRNHADRIERGEIGGVATLYVVMPVPNDYPRVWGWGDIDGINHPALQLELARMWLLNNIVTR